MKKYPKIKRPSDPQSKRVFEDGEDVLYVLEKLDGSNFRFKYYDEGSLLFGTRRVVFSREDGSPMPIEETEPSFHHVQEYIYNNIDMDSFLKYKDIVFFGEAMQKNILEYTWESNHPKVESEYPNFIGFDAYSEERQEFLTFEEVIDIFEDIGLELAPIVEETNVEKINLEDLEIPKSKYREASPESNSEIDKKGLAEGVVLVNNRTRARTKIIHPERDESYSSSQKQVSYYNKADKFVDKIVTEERIEKNVMKILEERDYEAVQMEMMTELPQRVVEDGLSEEGWSIICNEEGIEFNLDEENKKRIRKKVSNKCTRVIRKMSNNI